MRVFGNQAVDQPAADTLRDFVDIVLGGDDLAGEIPVAANLSFEEAGEPTG